METISINDSATEAVAKINCNFNTCGPTTAQNASDEQMVFLGNLVQSGNWVSQKDITTIVDYGITYKFVLPEGIVAKVEHGNTRTLGTTVANLFNGDSVTFPTTSIAQRISFARYDNNAVAALQKADCMSMIAAGTIRVTISDYDVVTRNLDKEPALAALTKLTYNSKRESTSAYYHKAAPLIAHTSDLHGDAQRCYNMMRYAKHYGIDECVISGDSVLLNGADGNDYVFAAAKQLGVHVCMAMGNHEVYPQASSVSEGMNYTNFLSPYASEFGYLKAADTTTDRGYYYHDLTEKKIRIIVLDQYDGGVYGGSLLAGRISAGQVEFLINAMKAPSGYGIVIVMHSPENSLTKPTNTKFNTTTPLSGNNGDNYSYAASGAYNVASRPISKIVDAFISRTSVTVSWTQADTSSYCKAKYNDTVEVTADFTDYDSSVEFICYMSGHIHTDNVGYLAGTTNRQLMLNITSGNGHVTHQADYGFAGVDDIPRYGTGVTQDAFNVYAVDRANKQVRIIRIGSNVKKDLTLRDALIVDY